MSWKLTVVLAAGLLGAGCSATYVTPGPAVSLSAAADPDLRRHYQAMPASPFPANVALARVQGSTYSRQSHYGMPNHGFDVITTREVESDAALQELVALPMVQQVAPLGRLLLAPETTSIDDLRAPAARLRADLLLVYSIDTSFSVAGKSYGPLSAISLGFLRNKEAQVTATVAGALVDVRTGFIYGTTEASASEHQGATIWSTEQAINTSRLVAESIAFDRFVGEFKGLWKGVVEAHAATAPQVSAQHADELLVSDRNYRIRFGATVD